MVDTNKEDEKLVGIVMGSTSDWDIMKEAAKMCKDFGVSFEARALSAHRTPEELAEWMTSMEKRGCRAFIAGAGGAARRLLTLKTKHLLVHTKLPFCHKILPVWAERGGVIPKKSRTPAGAALGRCSMT